MGCRPSCGASSRPSRSGSYDLSSVSRIGYGGAPAAPELVERIKAAFPQVRDTLSTAYGLTETASVATSNAGDGYLSHPSSVGRAAPTVEIQVIDADGDAACRSVRTARSRCAARRS